MYIVHTHSHIHTLMAEIFGLDRAIRIVILPINSSLSPLEFLIIYEFIANISLSTLKHTQKHIHTCFEQRFMRIRVIAHTILIE